MDEVLFEIPDSWGWANLCLPHRFARGRVERCDDSGLGKASVRCTRAGEQSFRRYALVSSDALQDP